MDAYFTDHWERVALLPIWDSILEASVEIEAERYRRLIGLQVDRRHRHRSYYFHTPQAARDFATALLRAADMIDHDAPAPPFLEIGAGI